MLGNGLGPVTPVGAVWRVKWLVMGTVLLATAASRHLGELGFALGAVGALVLVAEAATPEAPSWARMGRAVGAVLIALGFVLGIIYIHGA